MSASLVPGQVTWSMKREREGHRTYSIKHYVKTSSTLDGPRVVMLCSGLPAVGSVWSFDNDYDPWAFCTPELTVSINQEKQGDPTTSWIVENTFTTIPMKRCQDESIEDPLLEPMRLSGTFVKYTQEAQYNMNGLPIRTSSYERITGPIVEFDANRPTVHIEQNVAALDLANFAAMIDTVNDATLWGMPARTVKFSNASWERKIFGTCDYYYTRAFDFDVNYMGFDRITPDEGTKALHGHWADGSDIGTAPDDWVLININGQIPNRFNPSHYSRFKDRNGENARVFLNGYGLPANTQYQSGSGSGLTGEPADILIQYYSESNLLLLGIPTSL